MFAPRQTHNLTAHLLLGFQQPIKQRPFVNVDPINAGHGVVEQQARVNLVEADALRHRAVGVAQNVPGLAGQGLLAPDLRADNGSFIFR